MWQTSLKSEFIFHIHYFRIEWQVFRNTENAKKSRKLNIGKSRKTAILQLKNKKSRKSVFLGYPKVKFSILKLSHLLNCPERLTKTY